MSLDADIPSRDDELIQYVQQQFEAARAGMQGVARRVHDDSAMGLLKGDSIAGYQLLGEPHRGGQGFVYEAIQRATKRRVAIKMLYEGPHAAAQRPRFEREVEILSRFRHPNIVTIHDSGMAQGRLYYVMDHIQGERLDQWCAARRGEADAAGPRPCRARFEPILRAFVRICDAVSAAHLRGVIHRDLKPGNILIDAAGEPRVLDFGLAKISADPSGEADEAPSMTAPGQFVGSLPWASPEQARGATDEIDTRTDVYALGVLLYQALSGRFPYRVVGGVAEVVRNIREVEPQPLNNGRTDSPAAHAGRTRGSRRVDDELETIVRKCLQKEPSRRYQTAGDVGRDLSRYMNHEPIEAKRDSMAYMLRKQLRRHRIPAAAAAAVLLACAVGFGASLYHGNKAHQQRIIAEREAENARAAEAEARRRLAHAEAVTRLLRGMFGDVGDGFEGGDITVAQMLDAFADEVAARSGGQPELELSLRSTLADAYLNLGRDDKAEPNIRRCMELARQLHGEQHNEYFTAVYHHAVLLHWRGDMETAERDYRDLLAACDGDDADALLLRSMTQYQLANLLERTGRFSEAESQIRQALEGMTAVEGESGKVGSCRLTLASILGSQDRIDEAEREIRVAIEHLRRVEGESSPRAAIAWNDYGELLRNAGRPGDAVQYYERAMPILEGAFGAESHRAVSCMANLGTALMQAGRLADAAPHLERSLELRRRMLPAGHPELAFGINNLASLRERGGDLDAAAALFRESNAMLAASLPPAHPYVLGGRVNLARVLVARAGEGDAAEAGTMLREVVAVRRETLPPDHPDIANAEALLGAALIRLEQWGEAEATLRGVLAAREKSLPPGHWLTANVRSLLGEALAGMGRRDEAKAELLAAFESMQAAGDAPPARLREACERIVRFYAAAENAAELETWERRLKSLTP